MQPVLSSVLLRGLGALAGDPEIASVVTDSREAGPGSLFVCIRGERVDGHDYALRALEAGAAGVVVQRPVPGVPPEKCVQVPDALDFASVDVSFISLKLILPPLNGLLKDGGHAACLVKPQFEAGREKVGKKGVVRDPAVHLEVLEHFLDHAGDAGFTVLGLTYSPIRGPEGNIEYLGYLEKGPRQERTFDLKALVDESHQTLKEHGEGGNP